MKILNKVLALVLALFTLLSVLPMSVFASDTWADVTTEPVTDGAKVTLTLDAGTLAEILERDGISPDLLQSLKSGIAVDVNALREAFSLEDLFDIIPRDQWLEVFKLEEIMQELGGFEKVLEYVNVHALLSEVLKDDARMAKLEELLASIDDLETCFDDAVLIQEHYLIPKDPNMSEEELILDHISDAKKHELVALVQNDAVKRAKLVAYFDAIISDQSFAFEQLEDLLYIDAILNATEPVINAADVVDENKAATEIQKQINNGNTNAIVACVHTDKVLTYLENKYANDLIVLSEYVTLNDAGNAIVSVDYVKVITDGIVTPTEMMANENDLIDELALVNLIGIENVIDMDEAKTAVLNADHAKLLTEDYVNFLEAFHLIGLSRAIELVGGYPAAIKGGYIDVAGLIDDVDLQATIKTILDHVPASELKQVIYFNEIFAKEEVTVEKILEIIPAQTILAQISDEELIEIIKTVNIKDRATDMLVMVFDHVLKNVNGITLNGHKVAAEKTTGTRLLEIYPDELILAIQDLIPTLSDIANMEEGKLLTLDLTLDYNVDETVDPEKTEKTKRIVFELVLEGDMTRLQNAAKKLQSIIGLYINELTVNPNSIVIDINAPETFSILYGEIIDPESLENEELREKILNLVNMDGEDMTGFVGELTFAEVLELLNAIDPEKLYDRIKAETLLETCLEKLSSVTGKDVSALNINEIIHYIASNESTVESVCQAIENRTGRDVLAMLEKLSVKTDNFVDKAEEREEIQKMLAAVESKLNIDASEISVEEILNRGKDVPILEKVSELVAKKVGVDVREILLNNTVNELYEKALAKLEEREGAYNKVKNYLLTVLDKLPDSVMNVSINDFYNGEGEFGKSGSISYNPKELLQKVVDKVLAKLDIDSADKAAEIVMSCIADAEWTTDIDLKLNFNDIRRITFKSRDGETVLLNAYLPIGTDLSIFENNKDLTAGYVFEGWATYDEDGNVVEITTMPDHDVTVYADLHMIEVTFWAPAADGGENTYLGKIMMPEGATLADVQDQLDAILNLIDVSSDNAILYPNKRVDWYRDDEKVIADETTFAEGDKLVYGLTPNWYLTFESDEEIKYHVTADGDTYTIHIDGNLPTHFVLNMDRAHLIAEAMKDGNNVSLSVSINGAYNFLVFDDAILTHLGKNSTDSVLFSYQTTKASGYYEKAEGVANYSFSFNTDGDDAVANNFGTGLTVEVPFAFDPSAAQTNVYVVDGNEREKLEKFETIKENDDPCRIRFSPAHFSEFMVASEYALTYTFYEGEGIVAEAVTEYYPKGAAFPITITAPNGYAIDTDKKIVAISNEAEYEYGLTVYTVNGNDTLKVYVTGKTYYVYYYVNGALVDSLTQAYTVDNIPTAPKKTFNEYVAEVTDITVPEGYAKSGKWVGFDEDLLASQDLYVYGQWDLIKFTIKFFVDENDNNPQIVENVTYEMFNNQEYAVPAVPAKDGYKGVWKIPTEIILEENVLSIYADYSTALTFPIVTDQNASVSDKTASAGEVITVTVTNNKTGYDATVTVTFADNGETKDITADGKFTMRACAAYINVTYAPKKLNYTINGFAGTGNYGETIPVPEIVVTPGTYLAFIEPSDICQLVSYTRESDGTLKLNYAFVLTEDVAITYEIKETSLTVLQILNGKLFGGDGDPTSDQENVNFEGWSEKVASVFQFAMFSLTREPASLLWLWILLGVLLLIALIALIYVLHITGKIGVNFLTRFVVWIVGLFFALCLAVAALGLKIAHLFGKSEDPADYGFTEVESEKTAEENTESAEETAQPTEEAPVEESTETSAESTEEKANDEVTAEDVVVADAVTEAPVAEETPANESVVEEAIPVEETPAEEVTAEEAVAEETPAEEVAAEEAVVEEAPVEEVATEEAVAEETPVEEVATEEAVAEEAPVEEVATEEAVAEDAPVEEVATEEAVAEEAPVEEVATEEAVAEEAPVEEVAAEEAVAEEAPVEEVTAEEAVVEDAPVEETTEEAPAEEVATEETAETEQSDDETKNNK